MNCIANTFLNSKLNCQITQITSITRPNWTAKSQNYINYINYINYMPFIFQTRQPNYTNYMNYMNYTALPKKIVTFKITNYKHIHELHLPIFQPYNKPPMEQKPG